MKKYSSLPSLISLFSWLSGGNVSDCSSPNRGGRAGQRPQYSHSLARPQVGRPQLKTSIQSDQVDWPIPYRKVRQVDTRRGERKASRPCGLTVRFKTDYLRQCCRAAKAAQEVEYTSVGQPFRIMDDQWTELCKGITLTLFWEVYGSRHAGQGHSKEQPYTPRLSHSHCLRSPPLSCWHCKQCLPYRQGKQTMHILGTTGPPSPNRCYCHALTFPISLHANYCGTRGILAQRPHCCGGC